MSFADDIFRQINEGFDFASDYVLFFFDKVFEHHMFFVRIDNGKQIREVTFETQIPPAVSLLLDSFQTSRKIQVRYTRWWQEVWESARRQSERLEEFPS